MRHVESSSGAARDNRRDVPSTAEGSSSQQESDFVRIQARRPRTIGEIHKAHERDRLELAFYKQRREASDAAEKRRINIIKKLPEFDAKTEKGIAKIKRDYENRKKNSNEFEKAEEIDKEMKERIAGYREKRKGEKIPLEKGVERSLSEHDESLKKKLANIQISKIEALNARDLW